VIIQIALGQTERSGKGDQDRAVIVAAGKIDIADQTRDQPRSIETRARSLSVRMNFAMRSLMLPPGFRNSHLAKMLGETSRSGVLPTRLSTPCWPPAADAGTNGTQPSPEASSAAVEEAAREASRAAAAKPAPIESTQVVVGGLVSVASIATFKRQLGRLPGVKNVKTYKADPEAFSALKAKKIDAWISDKFVVLETLSKNPDAGIVAGDMVFVERVSLIMRKNNKEFMDTINQALADLTKDGTLKTISEKYFKQDITCK